MQHVRGIINKSIIITSGVRREAFNSIIKGSLVSSHIPNGDGMVLAVNMACTSSRARYEMLHVEIKFFRHIGIECKYKGNFIHLDVYPSKSQNLYGLVEG